MLYNVSLIEFWLVKLQGTSQNYDVSCIICTPLNKQQPTLFYNSIINIVLQLVLIT
nr:MAG TPA: hypothetical protein [Crassvirales sp.]